MFEAFDPFEMNRSVMIDHIWEIQFGREIPEDLRSVLQMYGVIRSQKPEVSKSALAAGLYIALNLKSYGAAATKVERAADFGLLVSSPSPTNGNTQLYSIPEDTAFKLLNVRNCSMAVDRVIAAQRAEPGNFGAGVEILRHEGLEEIYHHAGDPKNMAAALSAVDAQMQKFRESKKGKSTKEPSK